MQPNHVKVLLKCTRHREFMDLCVRVQRAVPDRLRCQAGGGAISLGTGNPLCPECQDLLQGQRLAERVNDLTRHGWSEHLSAGAVVVAC
jgi:hypothetical protein